jgi:hypothetical protein
VIASPSNGEVFPKFRAAYQDTQGSHPGDFLICFSFRRYGDRNPEQITGADTQTRHIAVKARE